MITSKHLIELGNSCIEPDVAALNFRSIDGSVVYDYLCYSEKLERLNAGRLARKWVDRYAHCETGGWWASGLDPLNDWQPMQWGCFKPDSPKEDYQKPGKFVKYEHPAKVETRAFYLRVSFSQSWRIAKGQGEKAYEGWFQRFWESAKTFITEEYGYTRDTQGSPTSGQTDRNQSSESTSIRELYEACERGEHSRLDELLQAVWDRPGDSPIESGCTDSRGIERLGSLDDGKGFWEWVLDNPKVSVIITEGVKKAQCWCVL